VLGEVLLWRLPAAGCGEHVVPVQCRFVGHRGVIFGIDMLGMRICSVSDDRTMRLWTIPAALPLDGSAVDAEPVVLDPDLTAFGHDARVRRCALLEHCVVTVGEDSQTLVWSMNGTLLRRLQRERVGSLHVIFRLMLLSSSPLLLTRYRGHVGRGVWSLAVQNGILATGGHDNSVRLWSVQADGLLGPPPILSRHDALPGDREQPRALALLDETRALVLADSGIVYLLALPDNQVIYK
jgi:WD40 repeat protein